MKFSTVLALLGVTVATVSAGPAFKSSQADGRQWLIHNMSRICDAFDTVCTISFDVIDEQRDMPPVRCVYQLETKGNVPASQGTNPGNKCPGGQYVVSSTWSNQFDGAPFTSMSVVDYKQDAIAYPAYQDSLLGKNGEVVPDIYVDVGTIPKAAVA